MGTPKLISFLYIFSYVVLALDRDKEQYFVSNFAHGILQGGFSVILLVAGWAYYYRLSGVLIRRIFIVFACFAPLLPAALSPLGVPQSFVFLGLLASLVQFLLFQKAADHFSDVWAKEGPFQNGLEALLETTVYAALVVGGSLVFSKYV